MSETGKSRSRRKSRKPVRDWRNEADWRDDERGRRTAVLDGRTVVANAHNGADPRKGGDPCFVAWAEAHGLAVWIDRKHGRIDRGSGWGNPFEIPRDGNRDEVCAQFADYLARRPELLARIPAELRGKGAGLLVLSRALPRRSLGGTCQPGAAAEASECRRMIADLNSLQSGIGHRPCVGQSPRALGENRRGLACLRSRPRCSCTAPARLG